MENADNDSNQTTVEDSIPCSAIGLDGKQMVFLFAFNVAICISAILENILILVVFRKVSSLHPPSKLLFECLAFTDLAWCWFITPTPSYRLFYASQKRQDLLLYQTGVMDRGCHFLWSVSSYVGCG